MSIRTTVSLDEDVLERVKAESRAPGASFKETLNDLLRLALIYKQAERPQSRFTVRPFHMGQLPGVHYDSVESLVANGEGEAHR